MRDPDLVLRAQRAAAVLEQAWDRWRKSHGLGAESLPPVSSYVGYSLEEPWGRPRVVFGVAAEEAEQLAALLERHECASPAGTHHHAAAGQRPADDLAAWMQQAPAGSRLQAPPQAPAGPPGRLSAAEPPAGARLADLPRANGTTAHGALGSHANGTTVHGALGSHANGTTVHGALGSHANGTTVHGALGSHANGAAEHGSLAARDPAGPVERPAPAAQVVLPLHPAMPVPPVPVTPPVQHDGREPGWAAISGYAPPSAYPAAGSASQAIYPAAGSASQAMPGAADNAGQADQLGFQANGSDTAMMAFRPGAEPVSFPGEKPGPSPFADDDQAAGGQAARRPRSHRHAAGHAVQHPARQKRASAAAERDAASLAKPTVLPQGASRRRDGRGSSAMAGDLAGWASGELPGQARRQPAPGAAAASPDLDDAKPADGEPRRDNAS